jgi:signal recognition particle receptor subunit beta
MVQINFANREVNCKIVYYGPGRSGKTTNIEVVHAQAPEGRKGKLVSIATEKDRTLYFDFLPIDLGKIAGMNTKFQLYTVPGQVFYNATRKLVVHGADAIVFVADSNPALRLENIESVRNMVANMKLNGLGIVNTPLVFQWNKRDHPDAMSVAEMNADLNPWNAPTIEAVAFKGEGVMQTLKMVAKLVIGRLSKDFGKR